VEAGINAPAVAPLMDHCRPLPVAFWRNCGSVPPYNKFALDSRLCL
jgi:hypothetical protein